MGRRQAGDHGARRRWCPEESAQERREGQMAKVQLIGLKSQSHRWITFAWTTGMTSAAAFLIISNLAALAQVKNGPETTTGGR